MFTEYVLLSLAFFLSFGLGFTLFHLSRLSTKIDLHAEALAESHSSVNIDEIKEEMLDLIEDFMGSMNVPTMADHLGGVLAQFGQMWAAKKAKEWDLMPNGPQELVENLENLQ